MDFIKVMDESSTSIDLETIKLPYLVKDKVLLTPGTWNEKNYSISEIKKAFLNTNWEDKEIRSLFLDHEDRKSSRWVGEVINPTVSEEGIVKGDLVIVNKQVAMDIAYGAKFGISTKVKGKEDFNSNVLNFKFINNSIVIDPACKEAYITLQQEEVKIDENRLIKLENDIKFIKDSLIEKKLQAEEPSIKLEETKMESVTPPVVASPVSEPVVQIDTTKVEPITQVAEPMKIEQPVVNNGLSDEEIAKIVGRVFEQLDKKTTELMNNVESKLKEKDIVIAELQAKVNDLNEKLRTPETVGVKETTQELSNSGAVSMFKETVDASTLGMMNHLRARRGLI